METAPARRAALRSVLGVGALCLALLAADPAHAISGTGEASFYVGEPGGRSCAAVPGTLNAMAGIPVFSDGKGCGQSIKVINTDTFQSVVVEVVGECVGCGVSDLDLSLEAFERIGEVADGRVDIEWYFVEGPNNPKE
ncbi:hypothetical protein ACWFQ8_31880 [Streptomyces sp. NPDC055254]